MKFIDEAELEVQAGHGGAGVRHFRREKFVPLGGPDGGNGGLGGSIILKADPNLHTLLDFKFAPKSLAEDGSPGAGARKDGKSGADIVVRVPVGTQVFKAEGYESEATRELVVDLDREDVEFVIAKGGRGGKGNAFFKSATQQAPDHAQPGEPGEQGEYVLSLKLVADVGLIGFPNAGKSTLISRISAARPKIADYPFTTLVPNLGVVRAKGGRSFVVADIPGLIEGASEGKGLGIKFLKHVERTRVLAHLIDPLHLDDEGKPVDPLISYDVINRELSNFSPELAARPQIVILTKSDVYAGQEEPEDYRQAFLARGLEVYSISSASGDGIEALIERLAQLSFV